MLRSNLAALAEQDWLGSGEISSGLIAVNLCKSRAVSGRAFLLRCLGLLQTEEHRDDSVSLNLWLRRGMEALGQELVLREAPARSGQGWELLSPCSSQTSLLCRGCSPNPWGNSSTQASWELPPEQNTWIMAQELLVVLPGQNVGPAFHLSSLQLKAAAPVLL